MLWDVCIVLPLNKYALRNYISSFFCLYLLYKNSWRFCYGCRGTPVAVVKVSMRWKITIKGHMVHWKLTERFLISRELGCFDETDARDDLLHGIFWEGNVWEKVSGVKKNEQVIRCSCQTQANPSWINGVEAVDKIWFLSNSLLFSQ